MTDEFLSAPLHASKNASRIRNATIDRRKNLADRSKRSQEIWNRLSRLPPLVDAKAIAFYVSLPGEVETHAALADRLQRREPTAVPFCDGDQLRLCWLQAIEELVEGPFGVLEPLPALRSSSGPRRANADQMDVILVPGVVFDRRGGRWGHGRGFYDRLLSEAAGTVTKIGLAFECQMVDRLDLKAHDIPVDYVVTEDRVYSRVVS